MVGQQNTDVVLMKACVDTMNIKLGIFVEKDVIKCREAEHAMLIN